MAAYAVPALGPPALPLVTFETTHLGVASFEGPANGFVVEDRAGIKARGEVTLLAYAVSEETGGMRVLVASHAARDGDGAKLALPQMAFLALGLFVLPGEGKASFLLVIEAHARIELGPIVAIVAALASVQIRLGRLSVVIAVACAALRTRP